jgi:hypothetical protein
MAAGPLSEYHTCDSRSSSVARTNLMTAAAAGCLLAGVLLDT